MSNSAAAGESQFIANSDYEVIDRNPLSLIQGQVIRLGAPDPEWSGWIWVTADDGRGSHVPEDICQSAGEGVAVILRDFQARDLSVQSGDEVASLSEINGWHWCRREDGTEGWLPAYLLRPCESQLKE
jgi:hypothetical protein